MSVTQDGNAVSWLLDRHVAEGRGARAAFLDPHRSLTYAALAEASARFAGALSAAGIGRERRMLMLMLDTVDFPVAFLGAMRAGVVPVPVNTLLTPEQVAYMLADSRAEVLCVSAPCFAALRDVVAAAPDLRLVLVAGLDGAPQTGLPAGARDFAGFVAAGPAAPRPVPASPDEVAFWLYSSGSTGAPKGAKHVHGSLRATAETYASDVLGIRAGDLVYSAAKLFFAYGLGNALTFPMSVGATAVLLPDRPTPDAVIGVMRDRQPTIFCGVPTLYAAMLASPALGRGAGSERLRLCISAGEALPEHVGLRWEEVVGAAILDGIGSTEMLHIFLSNRPDLLRYGTSGVAVPGYELRIVDEHEREVAPGEIGELLVRGPSAAEGYWNQREKSRRTFLGEWTRTGDKYVREADGFYRYQGRADDMFKVSGIWVSPFEVEAALMTHPAVQEAAVVGREDADGLVKPMAFLVLKPGVAADTALLEAMKETVKARAGAWKYPRWVEVVEELPKTATGKIQRFRLRAALG
ncbi:benzoate-CoA ligase family protein [Paracraurococcus lichenis]|uniref:Benzoate-CoA ligase family protein n=1 Tax=Paracraurococcus lichenis TaxID=3064888 RepID=A0ABT9DW40_9PROT|nr:benzoate-CoA ligase family protein [Paracraurococcus sp. LOR1-02]MDO9708117.1 benzoate-CoA ligase family protein [Paracraurococcus sp. LOR1-02]